VKIKIIVCLFCCLSSVFSCDAVLESLIFAKEKIDEVDSHFHKISTWLNELAASGREGKFDNEHMIDIKTTWYVLYRDFYSSPPGYFKTVADWHEQLDIIAAWLRELQVFVNNNQFEQAHPVVLRMQAKMIELYQKGGEKGFFERARILQFAIEIYIRMRRDKQYEDLPKLQTQIAEQTETLLAMFTTDLQQKWPAENFRAEIQNLQQMEYDSYKKAGNLFLTV
jgi:hypothetical protein